MPAIRVQWKNGGTRVANDLGFVKVVVDQIDEAYDISYWMMFGEYALYSKGKLTALLCDKQLFLKPTKAERSFSGEVVESSPCPGAKPYSSPRTKSLV